MEKYLLSSLLFLGIGYVISTSGKFKLENNIVSTQSVNVFVRFLTSKYRVLNLPGSLFVLCVNCYKVYKFNI